jgi:hypothetical protein
LPPEAMRDSHNAIYAAVLLLDVNQTDAAKEYVQTAKRGPLHAEEKRLLEDELTKISGASPSPTVSPSASPAPHPTVSASASLPPSAKSIPSPTTTP